MPDTPKTMEVTNDLLALVKSAIAPEDETTVAVKVVDMLGGKVLVTQVA